MVCASCGAENREGARFCDTCGAPLEAVPAREQRKVVTVLFCDVTGSTALGERLDPETLRGMMARYFDTARAAIERHGGTVEKFIGDAVMAVFGVPTVREDDALRAVRAAAELRDAVEIDIRIGVNTGEVVSGQGDTLVTGDAVNVAARLEQAAAPGEILLGESTLGLVRDAVDVEAVAPIEAKGKSEPVPAYRLVAVTGDVAVARRSDAPLVGRERERRLLGAAWERARSEGASALFTVLGNAGVGKSRLASEFLEGLDATVLRGRCLPYGDGITYWPVVEVVLQLLAGRPAPDPAIAALLGDGAAPTDEIAFSVRKLFEAAAAERPLVVLFDDLHWAEPTFLDLIEHIADWSRGVPILLLCLARPDLLDRRAGWGGGKLNATTVLLEPLTPEETDELIARLIGGDELDAALRARVREAADGNPLFVEQMLAMVAESGDGEVTVPPTIQALLAARLDQLPAPERATLERGAIEGQVFHRGAVAALAPDDPDVLSHLSGLVRKELVRPSPATLPGDDAFRFRHLLIRDAAYDGLPKSTRAELHERFAVWVEQRAPDLVELDEIVGYHLEQTALFRAELGTPAPEVGERAAARLGAAGRRAEQREDPAAAMGLLRRATALLPEGSPERIPLLPYLGRALYGLGELEEAFSVLDEAVEHGDVDTRGSALFFAAHGRAHTAGGEGFGDLQRQVREALAEMEDLASDSTLAEGYLTLAWFSFWDGRIGDQLESAGRARERAHAAGDPMLEFQALRALFAGMAQGATPWADVERFADEVRASADRLGPRTESLTLRALGSAATAQGRFDEAYETVGEYRRRLEERGQRMHLVTAAMIFAEPYLLGDEPGRAESILRESWDALGEMGEKGFRSTVGAYLAKALIALGRSDEALEILDEAQALSPEDWVTEALVREVRARAALARGEHEDAVELAREALKIAEEREYVHYRTELWLLYGEALAAADRPGEAREALEEGLRLADLKGSTFYAEQARAALGELAPAS